MHAHKIPSYFEIENLKPRRKWKFYWELFFLLAIHLLCRILPPPIILLLHKSSKLKSITPYFGISGIKLLVLFIHLIHYRIEFDCLIVSNTKFYGFFNKNIWVSRNAWVILVLWNNWVQILLQKRKGSKLSYDIWLMFLKY